INIATREQAQAFDQLGNHVMSIGERLERLERNTAQDGLKDAVKALHQGLSRLADQISQTANQSAQQVTSISGNLEQLAGRLGQLRMDFEATAQRLEARMATSEEDGRRRFIAVEEEIRNRFAAIEAETARTLEQHLQAQDEAHKRFAVAEEQAHGRFAAFEAETSRTLDQRLAAVEKASQFNTTAIDSTLERLEAQVSLRADDQAELRKRHAEIEGAIDGLEESVQLLESKGPDTGLEKRLDSIERSLGSLVSRLESHNPSAHLEDALHVMA